LLAHILLVKEDALIKANLKTLVKDGRGAKKSQPGFYATNKLQYRRNLADGDDIARMFASIAAVSPYSLLRFVEDFGTFDAHGGSLVNSPGVLTSNVVEDTLLWFSHCNNQIKASDRLQFSNLFSYIELDAPLKRCVLISERMII
jgi:hypothetical protein